MRTAVHVVIPGGTNMRLSPRRIQLERLEDRAVPSAPGDIDWLHQVGSVLAATPLGRAVDGDGNIYLAGTAGGALPGQTAAGGFDAFVRKYDAAGNELWTREFGTPGADSAEGVAVDATGVYVVGTVAGILPGQTGN